MGKLLKQLKNPQYTSAQKAAIKRGVARGRKVVPVGVGMKNVGLKIAKKAVPKAFKVAGQRRKVKVNNWANATQKSTRISRRPRLTIKKR